MFALAFLLAGFSYILFFIGFLQLFTLPVLLSCLGLFSVVLIWWGWNNRYLYKQGLKLIHKQKKDILFLILVAVICLQLFVDILGVLSPETAFDALWYHLTIPKLFLLHGGVYHISGGLLYYTDMPKLAEMLYLLGLWAGSDITAHGVHFLFGILTLLALYFFGRKFFPPKISLLAVAIFSTNIIFHWEITTAYIDVVRTFYEVMALWAFVLWHETKQNKWLFTLAFLVGCSIAVKLISFVSIVLFAFLIIFFLWKRKEKLLVIVQNLFLFSAVSLLVPIPYFLFGYIHTGNPIFPLLSSTYPIQSAPLYNPVFFFWTFWNIFTHAGDIISPLYLIFLPPLFYFWKKLYPKYSVLYLYTFVGLLLWYFIPQRNEARFLLPLLPGFSLLCASLFTITWERKGKIFLLSIVLTSLIFATGYRLITNIRYIPVISGKESKGSFLGRRLNFSFGDFYDTDHYFATHIKPNEKVLLYGFHNLYYIDFPFIDNSWVKRGDTFRYIAVQDGKIPQRFADWKLVYENHVTHVQLYQKGNNVWSY